MSAERILRPVAPTLSATTSLGPSAVNVKMDIDSEVTGRPALVSGGCALPLGMHRYRYRVSVSGQYRVCTDTDKRLNVLLIYF